MLPLGQLARAGMRPARQTAAAAGRQTAAPYSCPAMRAPGPYLARPTAAPAVVRSPLEPRFELGSSTRRPRGPLRLHHDGAGHHATSGHLPATARRAISTGNSARKQQDIAAVGLLRGSEDGTLTAAAIAEAVAMEVDIDRPDEEG